MCMKNVMKKGGWNILMMMCVCLGVMPACKGNAVNNAKEQAQSGVDSVGHRDVEAEVEWQLHPDGDFKYPKSFSCTKTFVEEVPADVEVFSDGDIQLCYWPMLGAWSTYGDFPEEGVFLSPTEQVKDVTYRAESKGIASGHTQNGNIYYLKQKMISGGEVSHSKVLVLINPPALKDEVSVLTNEVANW